MEKRITEQKHEETIRKEMSQAGRKKKARWGKKGAGRTRKWIIMG